jgi:alkanesulfonate monooxygenase SsuD/methylene tetrahydromethanopterin reductase-like flavin-dependent oxidoreductase (luciferase family)
MQFGLMLTLSERYTPGMNMVSSLRQATHLVHLAREYGFDGVFSGEHFLAYPHQRPAPIPALSYLAAAADGMLVGTSVLLLPLHPVLLKKSAVSTQLKLLRLGVYSTERYRHGFQPEERP